MSNSTGMVDAWDGEGGVRHGLGRIEGYGECKNSTGEGERVWGRKED